MTASALIVLGLSLLAALSTFAYRGWFARYTADDYCTAGMLNVAGFLGAQRFWYETWSGRYTYYLVSGLVEQAGTGIVQVLPALALALWTAVGAWAVYPLVRDWGLPIPKLTSAIGSAALVLVCVTGTPDLDQALYWQTGMLTYLLPLILLTVYAGWLVRRIRRDPGSPPSVLEIAGSGALLFATGGLSETSVAAQCALLGLAALWTLPLLRSRGTRGLPLLLGVGFVFSVLAAIALVAAPGNYLHEERLTGTVHDSSHLPGSLRASVDFVGLFWRSVQFRARPMLLLLLALSAWAGFRAARTSSTGDATRQWPRDVIAMGLVVFSGAVIASTSVVPAYFAQQFDPPERAQLVATWVIALTFAGVAFLGGRLVSAVTELTGLGRLGPAVAVAWAALLLVGALAPLPGIRDTLARVPSDAAYAADWDALDATIRAQMGTTPGQPVRLDRTLPTHYGFSFLGSDPGYYPNPCVAQFYRIPSITAPDEKPR